MKKLLRKRSMLLVALLVSLCMPAMAQRYYTFNAVALDVDGMPHQINLGGETFSGLNVLDVELNPNAAGTYGGDKAQARGEMIVYENWDIVGITRDYNFHDRLVAPLQSYYYLGTHGGGISQTITDLVWSNTSSSDGLGVFVANRTGTSLSGEYRETWDNYDGSIFSGLDGGMDNLTPKGFRYYLAAIAEGISVDVYVFNLDAGARAADAATRNAQLKELAAYITENLNGRPILVLGNSEGYYSDTDFAGSFIDEINKNERLTIKDGWVEFERSGEYKLGASAYGPDNGEVICKIFYINDTESDLSLAANTYYLGEDFKNKYGFDEHAPVIMNFTITDPNAEPLTEDDIEEKWTADADEVTGGNPKPKFEGVQVSNGDTYYMMNIGTGEYIKWGGAFYTGAVAGNAAAPVKAIKSDNGETWQLKTSRAYLGYPNNGTDAYLDAAEDVANWILEVVPGTEYQYRIKDLRGYYLSTTPSVAHKPIRLVDGDPNNENQKWIFLTDDRIRTEMTKANADYPFNFTALLKSADFDVIEYEDGWTNNWIGFDWSGGGTNNMTGNGPFKATASDWGPDATMYSTFAYAITPDAVTMSQNLGTLPAGNYKISFEGFYDTKYEKQLSSTSSSYTVDAKVTFGTLSIPVRQETGIELTAENGQISSTSRNGVLPHFRQSNENRTVGNLTLDNSAAVNLTVNKPATASKYQGTGGFSYNTKNRKGWICVDDFILQYLGTGEYVETYKNYRQQVIDKINETYELVFGNPGLNEAGRNAYDISTVLYRLDNNMVTTQGMADALCEMVDEAYRNALAAHRAAILDDPESGGDITGTLFNPSFETADLSGWTKIGSGQDVSVQPNSNATYTTSGTDGSYLFNSWNGDTDMQSASIEQTIKFLKNGLYELKASLASFGATDQKAVDNDGNYVPYTVYIFGNSSHKGIQTTQGKTAFMDATLYFLVEDGTATIGAVGGDGGCEEDGDLFQYFDPNNGSFFKADNFRLKYVTDVPNGRVKLALDELREATIDAYGDEILNLDQYQDQLSTVNGVENVPIDYTYVTADAAVEELRSKVIEAGKAQGRRYNDATDPSDMTWAIENPSFEDGSTSGWTHQSAWQSFVPSINDNEYAVGAHGNCLFNMWNDHENANNSGVNPPIKQTISGIKNGKYRLSAMVASSNGNTVYLAAKDGVAENYTYNSVITTGDNYMKRASVEFEVTDHTATFMVSGGKGAEWAGETGGCWYKADDFRLQYIGHAVELNQENKSVDDVKNDWYTDVNLKRAMTNMKWHTFVVPFDIPADVIADKKWDVRELYETTIDETGFHLTLKFRRADEGIKAGVSYMVRYYPGGVPSDDNTTVQETAGQTTGDIPIEYVNLDKSTLIDEDDDGVETTVDGSTAVWGNITFAGTYVNETKLPDYAFYVSNNKFYLVNPGETITTKGYRGYFVQKPNPSSNYVRSLGMRSEDATLIESVNNDEVKVVGIYDVNGVRREEMQDGINIVKMSDGSSVKIFINE